MEEEHCCNLLYYTSNTLPAIRQSKHGTKNPGGILSLPLLRRFLYLFKAKVVQSRKCNVYNANLVRNLLQCLSLRGIWVNIPVAYFVFYSITFSKSHNGMEFSGIISSGLAREISFFLLPLVHVHWNQPFWLEKDVKKHTKPVNEVKLLLCFPPETTIPANKLRTWKQILSCRGS